MAEETFILEFIKRTKGKWTINKSKIRQDIWLTSLGYRNLPTDLQSHWQDDCPVSQSHEGTMLSRERLLHTFVLQRPRISRLWRRRTYFGFPWSPGRIFDSIVPCWSWSLHVQEFSSFESQKGSNHHYWQSKLLWSFGCQQWRNAIWIE